MGGAATCAIPRRAPPPPAKTPPDPSRPLTRSGVPSRAPVGFRSAGKGAGVPAGQETDGAVKVVVQGGAVLLAIAAVAARRSSSPSTTTLTDPSVSFTAWAIPSRASLVIDGIAQAVKETDGSVRVVVEGEED